MGYIDWVQELSRASTGYQDHRMFGGNGALENTSTLGILVEDVRIDALSRYTNGHIPF
jgi:hypothetical protein